MLFSGPIQTRAAGSSKDTKPSKSGINTNGAGRLKYVLLAFPETDVAVKRIFSFLCRNSSMLHCYQASSSDFKRFR